MTRDEFKRLQLKRDVSPRHDTRAPKPCRTIYTRAARRELRRLDVRDYLETCV